MYTFKDGIAAICGTNVGQMVYDYEKIKERPEIQQFVFKMQQ
jgi:hypothetical protein